MNWPRVGDDTVRLLGGYRVGPSADVRIAPIGVKYHGVNYSAADFFLRCVVANQRRL